MLVGICVEAGSVSLTIVFTYVVIVCFPIWRSTVDTYDRDLTHGRRPRRNWIARSRP